MKYKEKYKSSNLPKQLTFSFMKDLETEKRASLSKEEHDELIQALAELMITSITTENLTKTQEAQDEH